MYREDNVYRATTSVCALGLFLSGFIFYSSALVEGSFTREFSLSNLARGIAVSATICGAVLGALIAGPLADALGRRTMLYYNFLILSVLSLLGAFAVHGFGTLTCLRFIDGFFAGTLYPLCAAFVTDTAPPNRITQRIAILMFVNCLAAPIGCLITEIFYADLANYSLWRFLLLAQAFPAFFGYLVTLGLPESSAWLNTKQQHVSNGSIISCLQELFQPKFKTPTIVLMLSWFLMDVAYYGVNFFTPFLLTHVRADRIIQNTLWINCSFLAGAFLAIFIAPKVDLPKLQSYGFLSASISFMLLTLCLYSDIQTQWLIIGCFMVFNFSLNVGPDVTTYLLPATLYPVKIRGTAHGFITSFAKLGSFISVLILPVITEVLGMQILIFTLAIFLFIAYVISRKLNPQPSESLILQKEPMIYETD